VSTLERSWNPLLKHVYLAETPKAKLALAQDETVINPYYMRQLLEYGIKLGQSKGANMDSDNLLREAEVSDFLAWYISG
jgi:hypothetical protein